MAVEDHRLRQREKASAMASKDQATLGKATLGHARCCHIGQSRFGPPPFPTGKRAKRESRRESWKERGRIKGEKRSKRDRDGVLRVSIERVRG